MKTLSIIRHAKAKPSLLGQDDFDRPLAARGHKDAKRIAKWLAHAEPAADWLISSPAKRTRETVEALCKTIALDEKVYWRESLYLATSSELLATLKDVPNRAEHVVLVGHNFGVQELVIRLCSGSSHKLKIHMPTGAWACLSLEIFRWEQIRWGCGVLRSHLPPKLLRKRR